MKKRASKDRKAGLHHRCRKKVIGYLCAAAAVVLLNGAAWHSTAFADWYIDRIFPVWVGTLGRFTGMFPFSVGEWMIAAGVILTALALALGVIWAVMGLGAGLWKAGRLLYDHLRTENFRRENPTEPIREERKGRHRGTRFFRSVRAFSKGFYGFYAWVFLAVCVIMTLNCFILYHGSAFSEHYFGEEEDDYSLEELIAVYNMAAERCNGLAELMERDENGMVMYSGSTLDMADMARELMSRLGGTYPRLKGYYPRPKALFFSDFMCQQYMQGYYFPFSMEANYNDVMHILNVPATMCHELAHLRGYIYEDEANFIGYLACVQSEDVFFQYGGYLSVLTYLNNNLYYARRDNREAYEAAAAVVRPVEVKEQVWADNIFVTQEEWDRINREALIDTAIVDQAADLFIDTNLKINGISDGKISYSRVVKLLLQYYRQEGMLRGISENSP